MESRDKPSRRRRLVLGVTLLAVLIGWTAGPALAASSTATWPREHKVASAAASRSSSIPPPTYNKKCDRTAKSQEALDRCVASQVSQLDGELSYALSVEATTHLGHSRVLTTESKWLGFMRSECTLESRPYIGGSIDPLVYGECERGLLFTRVGEIRSVVDSLPR